MLMLTVRRGKEVIMLKLEDGTELAEIAVAYSSDTSWANLALKLPPNVIATRRRIDR